MLPERWAWQDAELRAHILTPKRAVIADPRMGKTRVGVEGLGAIAEAYERAGRSSEFRAVWTGPRVTMTQSADVLQAGGLPVIPTWKTTRKRGAVPLKVEEIEALLKAQPSGVLVVNDDKLAWLIDALKKWAPQAVIGDESHRWRGVSTVRARAARRLCWQAAYVRLLTGTPAPSHYGNLWGQMVALDKRPLDEGGWGSSYEEYARRYLVRDSMFPSVVRAHVNTDDLQARLLRFASIYRRADIWGPDQYQIIERTLDMPEDIWALYHRLAREWILDVPVEITADNVLARLTRLRQICSGHLPNEKGDPIDLHSAKTDAVLADLYDPIGCGQHVAIFHRFRRDGKQLYDAIHNEFPQTPLFYINGDNSQRGPEIAEKFNSTAGAGVIVVQTQSGGVGISLRSADHGMFISQDFNFEEEKQALDRIFDQENGVVKPRTATYYRIGGSVEEYIAETIARKLTVHQAVTNADRTAMVYGTINRRKHAVA